MIGRRDGRRRFFCNARKQDSTSFVVSSVGCSSFVNKFLTWRCNKRLSRGQRKRVKKIWFCVEKEHFKASLGYVLCRLSDLANAGFRISGMATPRISWDVFVPSLLQTGTKLTRWEEVNRSLSVFNSYTILCGEKSQKISLCGEASQVHFTLGRSYVL